MKRAPGCRPKVLHVLVVSAFAFAFASGGHAQTQARGQTEMAKLNNDSAAGDSSTASPAANSSTPDTTKPAANTAAQPVPRAALDELDSMKKLIEAQEKRIEELELELKSEAGRGDSSEAPSAEPESSSSESSSSDSSSKAAAVASEPKTTSDQGAATSASASTTQVETAAAQEPQATQNPKKIDPFSDHDWTWLNGNPRTKDIYWDSKFFTPEIRSDVTYTYDFNRPIDNSMGGSSELFRANEVQLEQFGLGGDFHWDNVRARFMTQFGMYSTATIRNDGSYSKGQWDIADADRYLAEAYGGYHVNWLDGVNFDAGIFMSYVGLFSYYNFDNWAYQPSYVSSNTPWFFEGVRIQVFPNPHLKLEPWIINGWQSYGSTNNRHGLGGQIKWTPFGWLNIISNEYGLGRDDLYAPYRRRLHTDNSVEVKYYDRPSEALDKMAFSFTGDLGCEFGSGVACFTTRKASTSVNGCQPLTSLGYTNCPKQSFIGFMLYNRMQFFKDKYGLTIGVGQINNPGRYLVLLPPINGESASSAGINAPYFSGNPGDTFVAWDSSVTFDYMPTQYLTFRWEYDYRHANVPYWTGKGGMTPPSPIVGGGTTNNGVPVDLVCANGADSLVAGQVTGAPYINPITAPEQQASLVQAEQSCANIMGVPIPSKNASSLLWFPDLRKDENLVDIDVMVKF